MAAHNLELTVARSEEIQRAYREYRAVGLCTEPADFETAQAAITRLYKHVGRKRPHFVRLHSPLAAELYIDLYCRMVPMAQKLSKDQLRDQLGDQLRGQLRDQLRGQLGDQLRGQLRDQLRGQLGGQLWDQLWDQLWGQLGDQLWDQLWGQLGGQLRGQLRDQLRGQLGGQLWDQLRGQLRDQLWDQLRGQLGDQRIRHMGTWFAGAWDSYMWGWGDAGRRIGVVCPAALNAALDDHLAVSRSIGWWYPFDEFCVLTGRPDVIALDDRGRLHSTAGPALHYRDGYSLHAAHGVRVPAWIIERKEEITITKIDAETNAEIRRVMMELYGQGKYLLDSGATLVQHDQVGLLYRKDLDGDEPITMVRVLNSTPEPDGVMSREEAIETFGEAAGAAIDAPEGSRFKQYMIRVPPTVRTAHEAVAWTFGLEAETYHPALES